jgi:hypothetical protein
MIGWSLLAASSLSAGAAPSPEIRDDLRCFLVMGALAGTAKEGPGLQTAIAGTLYFLGKLEERAPTLDIEAAGAAELLAITEAEFQTEKPRCLAVIEEKGKRLIAIGTAIDKRLKQAR